MSDFEKVQIGFDVLWTILGLVALIDLYNIEANTWYTKHGYTVWGVER